MKHKTKPLIGYIILLTEVKPALYITLYPKFLNVEQVTHNRSSKMLGKNFPEPFHISGLVLLRKFIWSVPESYPGFFTPLPEPVMKDLSARTYYLKITWQEFSDQVKVLDPG